MLKRDFPSRLITGISIGGVMGTALGDIATGISMGAGSGVLVVIFSIFKKEK